MRKTLFILSAVSFGFFTSCDIPETENSTEAEDQEYHEEMADEQNVIKASDNYERNGLKIYPKSESASFPNASLQLLEPKTDMVESNEIKFKFQVENYELGKITNDAEGNGLANSDKGQHIHLIIDNEPYSAHYDAAFSKSIEQGDHTIIAFLSRSYHESVKEPDAYKVFRINNSGIANDGNNIDKPLLFYSRPKGEYKGADTRKILFDFYLHKVNLSDDGPFVKLSINDNADPFYFSEWKPFIVEGLPMGENTFKIELVDKDGNLIGDEFNQISRTFTLTQ